MPQLNEKTGKYEQVLVINKTIALKNKAFSSPSHELLHAILFSVLNGPLRTFTWKGKTYKTQITKKGVSLVKGFLELLPPDHREMLEEDLRQRGYKNEGFKPDGAELPFEMYAEEYLTHYHGLIIDKRISLNKPDTRSTLKKIADYFINFFKGNTVDELEQVIDNNLDTPEKLLDFMGAFNKQALEGKFSDQMSEMAITSQEYYGEIIVEPETKFSRAEAEFTEEFTNEQREELAKEVNDIYNDPKLTDSRKEGLIANKYRGMAEVRFDVALSQAVGESRNILLRNKEDIIAQMLYDPGDGTVKARNVVGLIKDFEAEKHKYKNLAAYINKYFKVRSYEVFSKWTKDKGFTKSFEDATSELALIEEETVQNEEAKGIQTGGIVLTDRIIRDDPYNEGKKASINEYVEDVGVLVNEDPGIIEGKNYKTLNDLNPRGTVKIMMSDPDSVYLDDGSPFWSTPKGKKLVGTSILDSIVKKLENNDNLNQQDIRALQPYLNKHNQILLSSLPQGFMTNEKGRPTTATGVQNVLLAPFYNKGRRVDNLYPQYKKPNIGPTEFLESQHGKLMTNQTVRIARKSNITEGTRSALENGKALIMFSRAIVDNPSQEKNYFKAIGIMDRIMPWGTITPDNLNNKTLKDKIRWALTQFVYD